MTHHNLDTRDGWPPELRRLLADIPRADWPDHPGFAQSVRNWMGAHAGFRRLGRIVADDTERFLDREIDPQDYAGRLGWFGNRLVGNLHGHHSWEDRAFFPELRAVDDRFDTGLEALEADHQALDATIDTLTGRANRVIKLIQLDEAQARDEAGGLHDSATRIERYLDRHLADEEDLIVPIVLHHRLRG